MHRLPCARRRQVPVFELSEADAVASVRVEALEVCRGNRFCALLLRPTHRRFELCVHERRNGVDSAEEALDLQLGHDAGATGVVEIKHRARRAACVIDAQHANAARQAQRQRDIRVSVACEGVEDAAEQRLVDRSSVRGVNVHEDRGEKVVARDVAAHILR